MNPNATRSAHPSTAQVETLVEFLERNPSLAKGFLKTQNAKEKSRRQWEEIAVRLNCLGGTIKNSKQWTKYWSDKKSAVKKKVAARSAARRRTGGGVEDEVELSELEERIVALCGGEGFSTGDAHLGIQPFPEINTPSPSNHRHEIQDAGTENIDRPIQHSPLFDEPSAMLLDNNQLHNRLRDSQAVSRRLFDRSSSSAVGISQSIIQDYHLGENILVHDAHTYHPSLSPPPVTLSRTPSAQPMPTPSPSRCGATQVAHRRSAASLSSRHATHNNRESTSISSPSRRNRPHVARTSRGAGSNISSRHTVSLAAPPPSQRRTEFATITERFLRVEEQQLEIQKSNARILQSIFERSDERERVLAEAVTTMGKAMEAVAIAIKRNQEINS